MVRIQGEYTSTMTADAMGKMTLEVGMDLCSQISRSSAILEKDGPHTGACYSENLPALALLTQSGDEA